MIKKKKRISYFKKHYRECPLCGKTRRAGYIVACPKCHEFLYELKLHIQGLRAYMEKNGYSLGCHIHGTTMNLSIKICVKGYVHSISSNISLNDLKDCVLPLEEILTKEICGMCERLVGKSILW